MELRVLRYFLTVALEENITRAAEALHMTQPTLSRQLSQLEEELGARLFERGARRITLTDAGLLLRRRAQELLALAGKTERELAAQGAPLAGEISLGCGVLESVRVLARLMGGFSALHPGVSFELFTGTADEIRERMDRGATDIALLLEPALSVTAVANSVGFENNLYFSKVFRKRTGLSPSEYRARKGAAP